MRHARIRDAAVALPLVGLFLLMPPTISAFVSEAQVGGVPLVVVYLFGVWLLLIACAAVLARKLPRPASRGNVEKQDPAA